ncbi:MAG: tRNA glutamyl-Q(34) synthetase GluQRS [Burkholderiaceae bacterium]
MPYLGRFAPSPTGPLHAGSLVAALASWLDARAHGGRWLLRIEDVDRARCVPGADREIIEQLRRCGLVSDAPPVWQSQRTNLYEAALERLLAAGWAYPCGCSRAEIEAVLAAQGRPRARHAERVYPGTCRNGLHGQPVRATRLLCAPDRSHPDEALVIDWHDRWLGPQCQDVSAQVGDVVLHRADGAWAYQLAVVVDDAAQGVTDVVRGADLADNTPRQRHLQQVLGLPRPRYLHTPLVRTSDGEKLSKRHAAATLDLADPLAALRGAAAVLGLDVAAHELDPWLAAATTQWAARHAVGHALA